MANTFLKLNYILGILMLFAFSCKDADFERKVDPGLKLQLKHLKEASQLDNKLPVLFKVTETLTEAHKSFLKEKNIKIIANIGPIYTAALPARSVYDLAKMKFVETIQSSRTLKATPADSSGNVKKF